MKNIRRFLAVWLTLALLVTVMPLSVPAAGLFAAQAESGETQRAAELVTDQRVTWREGARQLCALLGYTREDGAELALEPLAERIEGLSAEDDSLYLAILLDAGLLPEELLPIRAGDTMPNGRLADLAQAAFPQVVRTQEDAAQLSVTTQADTLLADGRGLTLAMAECGSLAVTAGSEVTLSGVSVQRLTVRGGTLLTLQGTQAERLAAFVPAGEETTVRLDRETTLPEILVADAGSVTIEGDGAVGLVCVQATPASLTVRATCSVRNETQAELALTGPDGETLLLAPGAQAELVLKSYIVSFVTEGTPVESQRVAPGEMLDLQAMETTLPGKTFTAWYEDAAFSSPYSLYSGVERQMTLYARFVDAQEAVTVRFETGEGTAVAPLTMAAGETLLCRPAAQLLTSREGYTFAGWCTDEACTTAMPFDEPITEDRTLYALFVSNAPVEQEQRSTAAELPALDWLGEIPVTYPASLTLSQAMTHITLTPGVGGTDPALSWRETAPGEAVLYGTNWTQAGETGFEPGSTFVLESDGVVAFAGQEAAVVTLNVAVYKAETEVVVFADDLALVLWDHVLDYAPTTQVVQEGAEEGENLPGTLLLDGDCGLAQGDVVAFCDGSIDADERAISAWEDGSRDGYVLFAQIMSVEQGEGGVTATYLNADPADFLQALDVHTTKETDLTDALTAQELARVERSVSAQVQRSDELRAQLLISVMTAPETQTKLNEMYGEGVYTLSGISARVTMNKPSVSLSVQGNTVTAGITVGATITLTNEGVTLLTITPTLSFEEALSVSTTIDGGWLWVDAAVTVRSKTTIRLEVTATSGSQEDLAILGQAKETLERIVSPQGLTDEMDYEASVSELMRTMQSLISTSLSYNDLFSVRLMLLKVTFHGIVTLSVQLDLVGQIGVLATFGVEIIATNGQTIGFKYNFLKFKGSSYKQNLPSDVLTQIYVIGKIGVRVGLRLTVTLDVLGVASVAIEGNLYVYAELTGMYFFTASLLHGGATSVGALYFEVGLDIVIKLRLQANLIFKTVKKEWVLWQGRFPLYSKSVSSKISFMSGEKLDALWAASVTNADKKSSYGFAYLPMKTYDFMTGACVESELAWPESGEYSLRIQNLVVDGETIPSEDPRAALVTVGGSGNGRRPGFVYVDESVAAAYGCEHMTCEVVLDFETSSVTALVKKQTRTFRLERTCALSTTTVNVQVVLRDWCAQAWGIEAADWDGEALIETSLSTTHAVGGLSEPTAAGQLDLSGAVQAAKERYSNLETMALSWLSPSRNGVNGAIQYSVPKTSSMCYLTPGSGVVRYDVRPETETYALTWYLYVRRFPGYTGEVSYRVHLTGGLDGTAYGFETTGRERGEMRTFEKAAEPETWSLTLPRAFFDGTDRALMMRMDGGEAVDTGLTLNGREATEEVTLEVQQESCRLTLETGTGVQKVTILSGASASGDRVLPGTQVTLRAALKDGYARPSIHSDPRGLSFRRSGLELTFTMPAHDLTLTVSALRTREVTFRYNLSGMETYHTASVTTADALARPADPSVAGMTFRGWYTDAACRTPYDFTAAVEKDLTLYADWTCNVTVDLGGAQGQALYVDETGATRFIAEGDQAEHARFTYSLRRVGETPLVISLPDYSGHVFRGWSLTPDYTGALVDVATMKLTGGVTLYALWYETALVTYDWNDGVTGVYAQVPEYRGELAQSVPVSPVRAHYVFTGWYASPAATAATRFDPATGRIQGDTTLYAGWELVVYTLTYDLAGGENAPENPSTYTVLAGELYFYSPQKAGYGFVGWLLDEAVQPEPELIVQSAAGGNHTLTAVWTRLEYTLTYDLVRGALAQPNPSTYNVETATFTLNEPTAEGFSFYGWTGTGLTAPTKDVTIPTGSTEDRTYLAVWRSDLPGMQIAYLLCDALPSLVEVDVDALRAAESKETLLKDRLMALLEASAPCAPYLASAVLSVQSLTPGAATPSSVPYDATIGVTYTDDEGNEYSTSKAVVLKALKRALLVETQPQASRLQYGQSLASSTLSGGKAVFGGTQVSGHFEWANAAEVPKAAGNGTALYEAVFLPDDDALYAQVTTQLNVKTQLGVRVLFTAMDRDYVAGLTEGTGDITLVDADDPQRILHEVVLNGGSCTFAQAAPGKDILVTYTGYYLAYYSGSAEDYALLDTTVTARAEIRRGTPDVTAPAPGAATYGDTLRDVTLTGGSAVYSGADCLGSWAWESPAHTLSSVGTVTEWAVFTPDDTIGLDSVRVQISLAVEKAVVAVPVIPQKIFSGVAQNPEVASSAQYSLTQGAAGVNAGSYAQVFTLTSPETTRWASDPTGTQANVSVDFIIVPATLTRSGTATVAHLAYGELLAMLDTDSGRLASSMISGVTVSSEVQSSVAGQWRWQTAELTQPLDAGSHTVEAVFEPTGSANYTALRASFTVVVEKATPDVTGVLLTATSMFQSLAPQNMLSDSKLTADKLPVNPVTRQSVSGTWHWEDASRVPTTSGSSYNVVFVPDSANYNQALSSAAVPFRDYFNVTLKTAAAIPVTGGTVNRTPTFTTSQQVQTKQFKEGETISFYVNLAYTWVGTMPYETLCDSVKIDGLIGGTRPHDVFMGGYSVTMTTSFGTVTNDSGHFTLTFSNKPLTSDTVITVALSMGNPVTLGGLALSAAPAAPITAPEEPIEPEDPFDPVEPEDPADPEYPEDPAEPEYPEDPAEPVEPEDPIEPVEPEDPIDPIEPESPPAGEGPVPASPTDVEAP